MGKTEKKGGISEKSISARKENESEIHNAHILQSKKRYRRIFVFLKVNKAKRIRAPPFLDLTKNKFQKQEEKKVKYAPKKVFVLENGNYKEITYSELKTLEQADKLG